jgi:hypothetical protein
MLIIQVFQSLRYNIVLKELNERIIIYNNIMFIWYLIFYTQFIIS